MQALYRASQAGVQIDLVIRGICCLRPGIKGLSENIRVRSIIGRFLEHTRVHYFLHGGEELVYCSSADWMDRNLFNRVETCFPIVDSALRKRVIREGLEIFLEDNVQAWCLQADGTYAQACGPEGEPLASQEWLLQQLARS